MKRPDFVGEGGVVIDGSVELMDADAAGGWIDRFGLSALIQLRRQRGAVLEYLADVGNVPNGGKVSQAPREIERALDPGRLVCQISQLVDRREAAGARSGRQVFDERLHKGPIGRNAEFPESCRAERIFGVDIDAAGSLAADVLLDILHQGD